MRARFAVLLVAAALHAQTRLKPGLGPSASSESRGPRADFEAGARLMDGGAGASNEALGLELIESAAKEHYGPALLRLGALYEYGDGGVALDNKRADAYYRQCAVTGMLECQLGLGRVLVSDSINRIEGMAWLELAADRGSAEARELFTSELRFTPATQLDLARAMKKILLPK